MAAPPEQDEVPSRIEAVRSEAHDGPEPPTSSDWSQLLADHATTR